MLKTLVIITGFVMVFHVTALTTPSAILQKSSTLENTPLPDPTPGPGSDDKKGKGETADLEKEEVQIDKEITKEILRRKNATYAFPKRAKETVKSDKKVANESANLPGNQCNNDLEDDLSLPGSLTLCTCGADEISVNGTCKRYSPGTFIDVEDRGFQLNETAVSNFRVRVQNVNCRDEDTHQNMTFEKGMFYLRNRGDVVLTDSAGHFTGLRINDYCVDYSLDEEGSLVTKLKACVPHPSVPRCCPSGQLLRNGTCHTGPSPDHLLPPMQADPRSNDSITWPVIKNHVNTLSCGDSETLRTVALDIEGSYLLSLPNGLAYRWNPSDPEERGKYMFCPDFCIDGRQGVDGSIEYLANFCYIAPRNRIKDMCKTDVCIQKCCKHGEIMSLDHSRCVKAEGVPFNPPVSSNMSDYEVIIGKPRCSMHLWELKAVVINAEGTLQTEAFSMPPEDYCIDTFAKQGTKNTDVLFCPSIGTFSMCKTDVCIQKCCKHGEIMSLDHNRCVKVEGVPFNPPVSSNMSEYEVIIGKPRCSVRLSELTIMVEHLSDLKTVVIDAEGTLHTDESSIPTEDYCIDTFTKQGTINTEVLLCPNRSTGTPSTWSLVRRILFPVCNVISLFFLGITVGFYLLAPVLLKQGGWHQLSYVLSLMLAYACNFSVNVYWPMNNTCVALALFMQYGYLSTFFWLCVMCFDIESKIRSLKNFRAYVPYHNVTFIAFGFGCPLLITLITLIVHTAVPYDQPGIVRPSLGVSKCWFHDDLGLLVYFYGPIAVLFLCNIILIASTAWNYKKIEKGALGIMMNSSTENNHSSPPPLEYERQKQTKKSFAEFKHKFLLLSLMCFCWLTEVLSWKIPPHELWALTDVLNSLQGFFIFIIFLSNRRNRKVLKKRHPWLFSVVRPLKTVCLKLRGIFWRNRQNFSNSASEDAVGRNQEPSISSEFSELSENNEPPELSAS